MSGRSIAERLRTWADVRDAINQRNGDHKLNSDLLREAADELDRLHAEAKP